MVIMIIQVDIMIIQVDIMIIQMDIIIIQVDIIIIQVAVTICFCFCQLLLFDIWQMTIFLLTNYNLLIEKL